MRGAIWTAMGELRIWMGAAVLIAARGAEALKERTMAERNMVMDGEFERARKRRLAETGVETEGVGVEEGG